MNHLFVKISVIRDKVFKKQAILFPKLETMKNIAVPILFFGLFWAFSCGYTQKITDGKMAFERKQYAVAVKFLQKEYATTTLRTEKSKKALLLAQSYLQIHKDAEATQWFKTAYDNGAGPDALREYAFGLKRAEQYKEAADAFKNLGIEIGSSHEYRKEIAICSQAAQWQADTMYAGFKTDLAKFNTADADYAPTLFENGALVITSDRNTATGLKPYGWTGKHFSDLFLVKNNQVTPFDKDINTEFNEGTACFTGDFSEMYFTRCGGDKAEISYCKLYVSKRNNSGWSNPEILPLTKDKVNYGHPAISKDGKTLFFSANDPEGWGGYDIYRCARTPSGFEEPKILPRSVNTAGNEVYPTLDGDTLYFASDGQVGMGGLDIFKTYPSKDYNWMPVQNMLPPINSGADDFGYVMEPALEKPTGVFQQGFYTSNRAGGKGNDDIYRFERRTPIPRPVPPKPPVDTTQKTKPKPVEYKIVLDGFVLEKIYSVADNPNAPILGRKPLANSKVTVEMGGKKREMVTNEEGFFTLELDPQSDYTFGAGKEGYLNNQTNFSTKGIAKDANQPIQKFEIEIVLDKIFKNKEIVLENIYYDYDKWDIREDAKPTLDQLSNILTRNPTIRIQLASHTDCRGNDVYNGVLSQKRADAAVNYLISKGLDAGRLTSKGYGESAPSVSCDCKKCTEAEHQANRRTTFKIIE
jgi:peptidoglycan-associated lipoprotein